MPRERKEPWFKTERVIGFYHTEQLIGMYYFNTYRSDELRIGLKNIGDFSTISIPFANSFIFICKRFSIYLTDEEIENLRSMF